MSLTIELEGVVHGYGQSIMPDAGRYVCIDLDDRRRVNVQLGVVSSMLEVPSDADGRLMADGVRT